MKKLIKSCVCVLLMCVVAISVTACGKKLSPTTTDTSSVKSTNGVSTNGGMTVVAGDYLYFINGTKTNDGTSIKKNTRAAIYRVKYNTETGEIDDTTYEKLVSSLVGFEKSSLYVFGDFLYYAIPCSEKNHKAEVLYNKVTFMRYDIANKKAYELYTTNQNTSGTISYAYYVDNNSLNLLVYEAADTSITSLKIGKEVKVNYIINNVSGCIFAENNWQKPADAAVDASNFVYFTKAHETGDAVQTGVLVYRISPTNAEAVALLCDNGKDIKLLTVRNGKLIYSVGETTYATAVAGNASDKLVFDTANVITYVSETNIIYMENADGSISVLTYDASFTITVKKWKDGIEIDHHTVNTLSGTTDDKFSFVGLVTVDEEVKDSDPVETEKVQYLIYVNNNVIYKLEIARENAQGDMELSSYSQPIKLTTTKVQPANGTLIPEVIGNNVFALSEDSDKNIYMYVMDLSIDDDATEEAKMIGVKEEKK